MKKVRCLLAEKLKLRDKFRFALPIAFTFLRQKYALQLSPLICDRGYPLRWQEAAVLCVFPIKETTHICVSFLFGGDKRDRTADLLNAIQALSQLSYTPI